jgi:uncharacterized protein (UPF0332 family)
MASRNSLVDTELAKLTKENKSTINSLKRGANIEKRTGHAIDSLIELATRDRMRLAERILKSAIYSSKAKIPANRLTIARAYYAMYHAARAMVFFRENGDDFEEHRELPNHLPKDFPAVATWQNDLKTARLERNRADYDPYPVGDAAFAATATASLQSAKRFVAEVKMYLASKGCKV